MKIKKENKQINTFGDLTDEQMAELLLADDGCEDESNLISHEEVKKEYSKWLKK